MELPNKNIYFCQFSNRLLNNIYLPYAIRLIASYLVDSNACNINILCKKKRINLIMQQVNNPQYVFFSVYDWNFTYSIRIAEEIKNKYPSTIVVLGRHYVPACDFDFFKLYPFIDILVHGEEEDVCKQILLGNSFNNIIFNESALMTSSYLFEKYSCLSLCQFTSRFLNKKYNISYREIYESICKYAINNNKTTIGKEYSRTIKKQEGDKYIQTQFDNVNWIFEEESFRTFMINIELFYRDILDTLLESFDIKLKELVDIICFNRLILRTPIGAGKLFITPTIKECMCLYEIKTDCRYLYVPINQPIISTAIFYKPEEIKGID